MAIQKRDYTLFIGVLTALVAIGGSLYSAFQNRELEREQFESNLILKAVETRNIDSSRRNLKFLIESGFISTKNEKIRKVLTDSILSIKFPKPKPEFFEPENGFIENKKTFFFGQILNNNENSIDSVLIRIHKNRDLIDTISYSSTYSDKHGLFRLPLPDGLNIFKVSFSKKGYKPQVMVTSKKLSRSTRRIHLIE